VLQFGGELVAVGRDQLAVRDDARAEQSIRSTIIVISSKESSFVKINKEPGSCRQSQWSYPTSCG
jgi:hypothetical protein